MTAMRRTRLGGVRWLILRGSTPDTARPSSAIDWLMEDPVFTARMPVLTRLDPATGHAA